MYACFWFEKADLAHTIDLLGPDNVLFETDFPHTTCLFGNIQETIESGLGHVDASVRRKILWENAAALYRIEEPSESWRSEAAAALAGGSAVDAVTASAGKSP
jgi:hypothetical protein